VSEYRWSKVILHSALIDIGNVVLVVEIGTIEPIDP
jgi:hypothetical protein